MTADGPLAAYRARLEAGTLKVDPDQELAAEKLESLARALRAYSPRDDGGWRARLGLSPQAPPPPQGLYLHGGVGRGKSMLMDLFFATAPIAAKRRVHFHAFMVEVHERIHRWRRANEGDPIKPLAKELAREATLLCFDEFQVSNIADAMILGRLFDKLLARGVVVVATSNVAPDELYAGGLQRELFVPAIDLIRARLDVLALDGAIDYRHQRIRAMPVYHVPLGGRARAALERAFDALTDGEAGTTLTLAVQERALVLPRAARGVAMADFATLCEAALGAADYLALARACHTLILDGLRVLREEDRNAARRFITLVDALYEHRVKLICAAEAPPERLHRAGDHAGEFQRTLSRLAEMQSAEYLALPHLP
jgi:cell division protein ZapE